MSLYSFLFVINLVFGSFAIFLLYLANSPSKEDESPVQEQTNIEKGKKNKKSFGDGFLYNEDLYDKNGILKKGINLNLKTNHFKNDINSKVEKNQKDAAEDWDIIDPWEFKKKKKLSIYTNPKNMSSGEREVMKALKYYKIQFESEYRLPKYRYRWDFYCPEYNLFIEYDGQQHFFPKSFGEETEEKTFEDFQKRQLADKHKDEIVKELGGFTLRIPYNKKDETGILIKEKIQEIRSMKK